MFMFFIGQTPEKTFEMFLLISALVIAFFIVAICYFWATIDRNSIEDENMTENNETESQHMPIYMRPVPFQMDASTEVQID